MPFLVALMFVAVLQQEEVKFKPSDEFELKVDYTLKTRPIPENYSVDLDGGKKSVGPLPFVSMSLKVLRAQPGEDRVRIIDNRGDVLVSRKLKPGSALNFDLGFTADMKDRVGSHEFTIYFMGKKDIVSRILIHVAEDGTFLVNDEVRGKF